MKISQKEKAKTKAKIITAAVDLITQKGFKNASMREIAKNAGVSNPTIYNYFPTKEKLLYAYIEQKHIDTMEILEGISDFHTYTLREQLQTLIETELELYLEDREFVIQISELAFHASSVKFEAVYETREKFMDIVRQILDIAIEAGEIEEPPFKEHLPLLFWDYYILIVTYWVKDESEMFENTTQFIDHSMGLIEALLRSNILNKAHDLGMFLFKTHLLTALEKFSTPKNRFGTVKRKLKGFLDG